MSGLKIIIITSEFLPVTGGIGKYVYEISKNFPKENEVLIIAPSLTDSTMGANKIDLPKNLTINRIGETNVGIVDGLSFRYACKKALQEAIYDFKPDIIHSQSSMPDLFIDPKRIRVPMITTIHSTVKGQNLALRQFKVGLSNVTSFERTALLMGPMISPFEKKYYGRRNHFITVSGYCATTFKKTWNKPDSDVQVIPNGVDIDTFNPSAVNIGNYDEKVQAIEIPKVLFLARLVGIKGIDLLLDSIKLVNDRTKAHFIIAGPGKINESRNFDSELVSIIGYVPHEKTAKLFSQSDIYVLPSYHENCPLSLLEAMSSGLAVIATNVGGVPEIINNGENGILINNDVKELSEAIIHLVEDPIFRKKIGAEARRFVTRSYSWGKTALMTEAYYRKVIGE